MKGEGNRGVTGSPKEIPAGSNTAARKVCEECIRESCSLAIKHARIYNRRKTL